MKNWHEELKFIVHKRSTDKEFDSRTIFDCSCDCKYFLTLSGDLQYDWGVCGNRVSPRAGLLTFEHMGCPYFESANKE